MIVVPDLKPPEIVAAFVRHLPGRAFQPFAERQQLQIPALARETSTTCF